MTSDVLTAAIMHLFAWTDIWYAHAGSVAHHVARCVREREPPWQGRKRYPSGHIEPAELVWFLKRWMAGVRTGPDVDLICVKRCATNEEAERWLSPGGYTPLDAVVRSALKRGWLTLEDALRGAR